MAHLNILVVDDDELFRSSIAYVIQAAPDMTFAGMAENGRVALEKIRNNRPDLVLMDIQMPEMNGIECIRHIRSIDRTLPILILTTFNETDYIIQGLAGGANGYFIKNLDFTKLIQAIRDVAAGQFMLPAQVAAKLSMHLMEQRETVAPAPLEQVPIAFTDDRFSKKEQEILLLLRMRLPNRVIAEKCAISEGTLRNYLTGIYGKLNVKNRNEAIDKIEELFFVI